MCHLKPMAMTQHLSLHFPVLLPCFISLATPCPQVLSTLTFLCSGEASEKLDSVTMLGSISIIHKHTLTQ
jgi:hypothetical protein